MKKLTGLGLLLGGAAAVFEIAKKVRGKSSESVSTNSDGSLPVGVNLHPGEQCHFFHVAEWWEERTRSRDVTYAGASYRYPLTKHWRARAGRFRVVTEANIGWTVLDSGRLYITNKRVLFVGQRKTHAVPFSKIVDFTLTTKGIAFDRESGSRFFLRLDSDREAAAEVVHNVLHA
jgi:hypothetical protein